KGGVIGIAFVSAMLSDEARQKGGRADPRFGEEFARADSALHDRLGDPYAYLEKRTDGTFMNAVYQRLGWPDGGLTANPANRGLILFQPKLRSFVIKHLQHSPFRLHERLKPANVIPVKLLVVVQCAIFVPDEDREPFFLRYFQFRKDLFSV